MCPDLLEIRSTVRYCLGEFCVIFSTMFWSFVEKDPKESDKKIKIDLRNRLKHFLFL